MDHLAMIAVLGCLAELGSGKSREIAERLKLSPEHVSLLLGRCKKRGFVEREPYRRGRVRGFTYELTEKGANWILIKSTPEKKAENSFGKPEAKVESKPVRPRFILVNDLDSDSADAKNLNLFSSFLGYKAMQENAELKHKNQELKNLLTVAAVVIRNRSSETEYVYRLYRKERERRIELEHDRKTSTETLRDFRKAVPLTSPKSKPHCPKTVKLKDKDIENSTVVPSFDNFNETWWKILPPPNREAWVPSAKCPTWK